YALPSFLVLLFPFRGHAPGNLDLVVADPGRHHRPDHGVGGDHKVDDHRAVIDFQRLLDGRINVLIAFAAQPHAAVGVRQLHEVWDPGGAVAGVQVGVRVPRIVEQGLPLADHAQRGVVDHRDLDRDLVDHAG